MYQGLQASIIVYVKCSSTQKTYQMVLQTKTNAHSFQADKLFVTPTSSFLFSQKQSIVEANIEDSDFSFVASIPFNDDVETETLNLSWLASHDRHYALNGIYDYFICDDSLYNMEAISTDPSDVDISSMESEWFIFINEKPFESMIVREKVGCIVRPWYNLIQAAISQTNRY